MVHHVFSTFLTFFLRRVSHLKVRFIREILANIMKICSYFWGRLIIILYVQICGNNCIFSLLEHLAQTDNKECFYA